MLLTETNRSRHRELRDSVFLERITQPWIAITSYLSMTVTEVATTYGCNRITSPFRYSICSRTPHYTGKLGNVLLRYGASCGGMRRHQVLTNETKYTLRRWPRIQKKNLFITKYMNSGLHAYVRIDAVTFQPRVCPLTSTDEGGRVVEGPPRTHGWSV